MNNKEEETEEKLVETPTEKVVKEKVEDKTTKAKVGTKELEEQVKKDVSKAVEDIKKQSGKNVKESAKPLLERTYVIPLRKEWSKTARYKRANRAIKEIKKFLVKHMKVYDRDLENIKLDKYVNEFIWLRSIKNPPAKINVKAWKLKEGDKEIVRVELVELPEKLRYRKQKADNIGKKSEAMKAKAGRKKSPVHTHAEKKSEEDVKDEKEKRAAVVEAGTKIEKAAAKQMKHQSKIKEPQIQRKALAK